MLVSLTPGNRGLSVDQACGGMAIPFDTTQITSRENRSNPQPGDPCHALSANGHPPALAFGGNDTRGPIEVATCRNASGTASGRMDFESETFIVHADPVAPSLTSNPYGDHESREGLLIAHTLRGEGFDASKDGTGRGIPLVPCAFNSREDPICTGDVSGALGASSPQAQAIAYQCHGSNIGEMGTLRAGSGSAGGGVPFTPEHHGVRRLMPVETERVQGFPEIIHSILVTVCAGEKTGVASFADQAFQAQRLDQSAHADVLVRIILEQSAVEIRSAERSTWFASDAGAPSAFLHQVPIADFALVAAHMIRTAAQEAPHGREASQLSTKPFSVQRNGKSPVRLYGREIDEFARDAEKFTSAAKELSKFITSRFGPTSQNSERIFQISLCFVMAAISSFIPSKTRNRNSYVVGLETVEGYTLVPYRGKPMADGPRYMTHGNSMSVPVIAWIGRRIEQVRGARNAPSVAAE